MLKRLRKWWLFNLKNPVIRRGEAGAFKYVFRRFTLDIQTISSNFKARFTAAEHPYAYLLASKDDSQVHGYCQMIYTVAMLLTTDQGFVDDINKAIQKYDKRLQKANPVVEDETEEKIALEEVKQVQEYVEMSDKERKKVERGIDGRFKAAVKKVEKDG